MTPISQVSEILSNKSPLTYSVSPETSVYAAIQLMAEKNIGSVLVTKDDKLFGILTERDYTRKVVLKGRSSKETPVRDILSERVIVVSPEHTVEDCLRLMTEKRVRHLPVVENGVIQGVVSIGDLVNWVISAQQSTIHQLESYITGYPTPPV